MEIRVNIAQTGETNFMIAFRDDLPGLFVPGRSREEIRKKLPEAIKEILEANGHAGKNITISVVNESQHHER